MLAASLGQSRRACLLCELVFSLPSTFNLGPLVRQVFAWVWGRGTSFWEDFLREQGETDLQITPWRNAAVAAETGRRLSDLFPGDTFDEQRELTFTHPRTGFVVGAWKLGRGISRAERKTVVLFPYILLQFLPGSKPSFAQRRRCKSSHRARS